MKILNLFAGLGGNRTLWKDDHQITAIESNEQIASVYKKRFPRDFIWTCDAYEYLETNFRSFDFIWASPPCPTHTRLNTTLNYLGQTVHLPELRLYSIIIFLQQWFEGKYCVENVIPYYEALIKPSVLLGRHYFWTNFPLPKKEFSRIVPHEKASPKKLMVEYRIDPDLFEGMTFRSDAFRQILRNCVNPEIGEYILQCAMKEKIQTKLEVIK